MILYALPTDNCFLTLFRKFFAMSEKDKILFVDNGTVLRNILLTIIESNFDLDIIEVDSGAEAVQVLQNNPLIKLVICEFGLRDHNEDMLYAHLKDGGNEIPLLVTSAEGIKSHEEFFTFFKDNAFNDSFAEVIRDEDVVGKISSALQLALPENNRERFFKVNIRRFSEVNENDIDVYLQISVNKHVKILDRQTKYDRKLVEKFITRGVDYIYLDHAGYSDFIDFLAKQMAEQNSSKMTGWRELSTQDKSEDVEIQLSSIEQILECVQALGINEETVKLTKSVVDFALVTIENNKKLEYVHKVLKSNQEYVSLHAQLTSYIACSLSSKMDWASSAVMKSMAIASLFQNISLTDRRFAKIQSMESEVFLKLETHDQSTIKNHVFKSVEMLKDFPKFTEDANRAILNHHECPDGSGFPRGLTATQIVFLFSLLNLRMSLL